MDFLRGEPNFGEKAGNRNRNEPEPVEPNRGFKDLGMNRTEPNRGLPDFNPMGGIGIAAKDLASGTPLDPVAGPRGCALWAPWDPRFS